MGTRSTVIFGSQIANYQDPTRDMLRVPRSESATKIGRASTALETSDEFALRVEAR
jgi:hypothetical protein